MKTQAEKYYILIFKSAAYYLISKKISYFEEIKKQVSNKMLINTIDKLISKYENQKKML